MVEHVPPGDYTIPLGVARVVAAGRDVTLVGWGAQARAICVSMCVGGRVCGGLFVCLGGVAT